MLLSFNASLHKKLFDDDCDIELALANNNIGINVTSLMPNKINNAL